MRPLTTHCQISVAGTTPYLIEIGPHLLNNGASLIAQIQGTHVLIISDLEVAPLYGHLVKQALLQAHAGLRIAEFLIPAGEASKSMRYFEGALHALAALGATRDCTIIALGGGVVGDLAGFVAACWMRGVRYLQLPTTVLAMVDSAVGGKTAIDLPQGKNLVGAFHPPCAVIADTTTLETLPPRERRAGLAEVIKYGAMGDAVFFAWLEAHISAIIAGDPAMLTTTIAQCCHCKAEIVAADLRDHDRRMLLNFGHTFGHAIEAESGYGRQQSLHLNHGEAVAIGMMLAAQLSHRLGMATAQDTLRLEQLLRAAQLPTQRPADLSSSQLLARMRLDKKNLAHGLRLVLWRGIGQALLVDCVDERTILAVLDTP